MQTFSIKKIAVYLYSVLVLLLVYKYFTIYPVPNTWLRLWEISTTLLIIIISLGVGRLLIKPFKISNLTFGLRSLFALGLGFGTIAIAVLVLGSFAGINTITIWVLIFLCLAVSYFELKQFSRKLIRYVLSLISKKWGFGELLVFYSCLTASLIAFLCALAPPTYYDSITYHLALPAKYIFEGRIFHVPFSIYAHFPQNMEMLFTLSLIVGDDITAQLISFTMGILLIPLILIFTIKETTFSKKSGLWGVFLMTTAPAFILLSSETYVETGVAFWTSLSILSYLNWRKNKNTSWLIMCGIMGGFASGAKYTGALTPVILSLMALIEGKNYPMKDRIKRTLFIGLPFTIIFSPWLIKNYVFTGGNPVFPFLTKWFNSANVHMAEASANGYFHVLDEYCTKSNLLVELFKFPFNLITKPMAFGGGYDVIGDFGWALIIILLPLSIIAWNKTYSYKPLFFYSLIHVAVWVFMRPVLRFLFPLFPVLCLMAGYGIASVSHLNYDTPYKKLLSLLSSTALTVIIGLFTLSNIFLFYLIERVRDPFPVTWGLENRDAYLNRKLDFYNAMMFINKYLPKGSKILFVGDQRGYYCKRKYLAANLMLPQPIIAWANKAGGPEALKTDLLEKDFDFIFHNEKEGARVKAYGIYDFSEKGEKNWTGLLKGLKPIYNNDGKKIYPLAGLKENIK